MLYKAFGKFELAGKTVFRLAPTGRASQNLVVRKNKTLLREIKLQITSFCSLITSSVL